MNYPEQELQKSVAQWLGLALPKDCFWTAINPVPSKSKAVAGLSKAMGLKAGVPDLAFSYRGKVFFIELKAGKGAASDNQLDCHEDIARAGAPVAVCRSIDDIHTVLTGWNIPVRASA